MLQVGTKAPDFTLPDAQGCPVSRADFAGKRFVLYFYPKDSTPGCTRQACAFAGAYAQFAALGVPVVGVSKDSQGKLHVAVQQTGNFFPNVKGRPSGRQM